MAFERGVNAARNIREASLAAVGLELSRVPQDLPLNVQNMAHLVLTQDEMALTSMDVVQIVDQIRTSQVSCETVTRAFLRRAALAQHLVSGRASTTLAGVEWLDIGQLYHRTAPGACHRKGPISGLVKRTPWPPSRCTGLSKRAGWVRWQDQQFRIRCLG